MKETLLEGIRRLKNRLEVSSLSSESSKISSLVPTKTETRRKQEKEKTYSLALPSQKTYREKNSFAKGIVEVSSIFLGLNFCFPIIDIELTPVRVSCLTISIQNHGGFVVKKPYENNVEPLFAIANPMMKLDYILEKIGSISPINKILSFRFILDSVNDMECKDIENYIIYSKENKLKEGKIFLKEIEKRMSEEFLFEENVIECKEGKKMIKLNENKSYKFNKKSENIEILKNNQKHNEKEVVEIFCENEIIINKREENIAEEEINRFSTNEIVANELMKLQKIYESEKDVGRKIAYLRAASAVRNLPYEITEERICELKGVGNKLAKKIKEIIQTGKLKKVKEMETEECIVCRELSRVWGIGPSKALELFNLGIKNIESLSAQANLLNKTQKLGLKYLNDFETKIPAEKITEMLKYVKEVFATLIDNIDNYNIEVCGSYRRGKPHCGDMDILLSRKDGRHEPNLLLRLIEALEKNNFLTDHLGMPKRSTERKSYSYMGVCVYPAKTQGTHHRIDIKHYPIEEYSFALLYFTGSSMFNRTMRWDANKKGLDLSDHSLKRTTGKYSEVWLGEIPICKTEEDIFKLLSYEYKHPHERNI